MAGKAGAQRGVTAKVLKYMLENPGAYVRVEDMAYEFEASEAQVANAVTYVIRENKLPGLKVVQKGHVWQYEQQDSNGEVRWSLVRRTEAASGPQAILEDAEGSLWIAKPVTI